MACSICFPGGGALSAFAHEQTSPTSVRQESSFNTVDLESLSNQDAEHPSSAASEDVGALPSESTGSVLPEENLSSKDHNAVLPFGLLGGSGGSDASAYFHPTITSSGDSIADGQYVSFNVKYTIDQGKIEAGDYIIVTTPDSLKNVSLAVSAQVFASTIDLGGGQYKLVFNENAKNGISGSFSISAFGNNSSDSSTTATVTVNDVSKTISVGAGSHGGGVGPETRGIIKWGYEGDGYVQDTALTGIYDQDKDVIITYAIEVNPRMSEMTSVTVSDTVPAEMILDAASIRIVTEYANLQEGPELSQEEVAQIASVSGNSMVFDFGDRLDGTKFYRIYYDVTIPAGTKAKISNTSAISYTGDNGPDTEVSEFSVTPKSGYSSSIGHKSVDKTMISGDPNDQTVIYTIVFENDQGFSAGEISLVDKLDSRIKYLDSYSSDYFSLIYNEADNSVSISNVKDIPASSIQAVTIVTDFSEVPAGVTIENTVGGNTTKTKKVSGSLVLTANKTIDGSEPGDKVFSFELVSSDGNVLQTKQNVADGNVTFDAIAFSKEDIGVEHSYQVREAEGQSLAGYLLDRSVYTVTVTPVDSDNDGIIECVPTIQKDGEIVSSITFDNKTNAISIPVAKTWVGPQGDSVVVKLLADGVDTGKSVVLNDDNGWAASFEGMPLYSETGDEIVYELTEDEVFGVDADKYKVSISGDAEQGFTVTNTYIPENISITVTKEWNDENNADGLRPDSIKVQLYANDEPSGEPVTLSALEKWTHTWSDLFQKEDGKDIIYSVKEIDVPEGYESKVTGDAQKGFTIENIHEPSKEQAPVKPDSNNKAGESKTPQTSDNTNILTLVGLMASAFIVLAAAFIVARKRN